MLEFHFSCSRTYWNLELFLVYSRSLFLGKLPNMFIFREHFRHFPIAVTFYALRRKLSLFLRRVKVFYVSRLLCE